MNNHVWVYIICFYWYLVLCLFCLLCIAWITPLSSVLYLINILIFFLIIKTGEPEFITCSCCSMFIVCVVFSRSLLVFLSFLFFLPLYLSVLSCIYCLVIDLRLLITPLVSSNFSRIIRIDSSSWTIACALLWEPEDCI